MPTLAPRDIRLIAINSTAIEVQWQHPYYFDRGGIIHGYKIFVQLTGGGEETIIDIQTNATTYIVGKLLPATLYRISVLAYTGVGDGPRSDSLTAATLGIFTVLCWFSIASIPSHLFSPLSSFSPLSPSNPLSLLLYLSTIIQTMIP